LTGYRRKFVTINRIKINKTWTPSHVDIKGNEDMDKDVKSGAANTKLTYQHAVTKTWMLPESKRQFLTA
jgi:hypothetical protein